MNDNNCSPPRQKETAAPPDNSLPGSGKHGNDCGGNGRPWRTVSASRPCPKCGKPDWCRISEDGDYCACRRVNDGTGTVKQWRDGEAYLYRLTPRPGPSERWPEPTCTHTASRGKRADAAALHRIYSELLKHLSLSPAHEQNLRDRGLTGDLLAAGYRTLGANRRRAMQALIRAGLEKELPGVPGCFVTEKDGRRCWTVSGKGGLLIPVRDIAGKIVALMLRLDGVTKDKYRYLSTKPKGGVGPGAPVHVPLFDGDKTTVRVTEGVLKADVATSLSGMLTIGLHSVSSANRAAPLLKKLGAKVVRVAFDADCRRNHLVARQFEKLVSDLEVKGFTVELETWNEQDGKGIDDLLTNGHQPTVVQHDAVRLEVDKIVEAAMAISSPQQSSPKVALATRLDLSRPSSVITVSCGT